MIDSNETTCPHCGGDLKYYDSVKRIVRTKGGKANWIKIRRLKCIECGIIHRELPDYIFPYKHYEAEVIMGVLEGYITPETLGYEDYPCELRMIKWTRNLQFLL